MSSSSSSSDDDLILRAKRREEEEKKLEMERHRLQYEYYFIVLGVSKIMIFKLYCIQFKLSIAEILADIN